MDTISEICITVSQQVSIAIKHVADDSSYSAGRVLCAC